jgi:hypothetical protein
MNKDIKDFAVEIGLIPRAALEDPEGYDGYMTYDKLNRLISFAKEVYTKRAVDKCLTVCDDIQEIEEYANVAGALKQAIIDEFSGK